VEEGFGFKASIGLNLKGYIPLRKRRGYLLKCFPNSSIANEAKNILKIGGIVIKIF
jgi:hypothetical protein